MKSQKGLLETEYEQLSIFSKRPKNLKEMPKKLTKKEWLAPGLSDTEDE